MSLTRVKGSVLAKFQKFPSLADAKERQYAKTTINLNEWGLVADDNSSAVAEANYQILREAQIHAITQNDLTPPSTNLSDPLLSNIRIEADAGIYYIKGNSPFALTRAEALAELPAGGSFRRGIKWAGAGRHMTVFVLQKSDTPEVSGTWLYNNDDVSFYDHFQMEDMTLRSADFAFSDEINRRSHGVSAADSINGFYWGSTGWEKMSVFNSVIFEGFDTGFKIRGSANGDQHTFMACRFSHIIDKVFDIDNDQSVVNRMFGCDVFTYGDMFYIGPLGGGDFLWESGTVHQETLRIDGGVLGSVSDSTAAAAKPRALLHFDQGTVSTGAASSMANSNFVFKKLRVENYDKFNHLVLAVRDTVGAYGAGYATFEQCDFSVNFEWADGLNYSNGEPTSRTLGSNQRDLVYINKMSCDVHFDRCALASHQLFTAIDVGSSGGAGGLARITFNGCILGWDVTSSAVGLGPLSSKLNRYITSSDRCNVEFSAKDSVLYSIAKTANELICDDFSYASCMAGTKLDDLKWANAYPQHLPWPSAPDSNGKLFLPPGSVVTSVFMNKLAGNILVSATGGYYVQLLDNTNSMIWQTAVAPFSAGGLTEASPYTEKSDLTTPHIIPAVPNNWVRVRAFNGNASNTEQSTGGQFLVGYFSGN